MGMLRLTVWSQVLLSVLLLALPGCSDDHESSQPPPAPALSSPVRVTTATDGTLLVGDYAAGAVYSVDRDSLQIVATLMTGGRPLGVARIESLTLVGDEESGTVGAWDSAGQLQFLLGNGMTFAPPNDLAVESARGMILVVDTRNHCLRRFDLAGADLGLLPDAAETARLVNPTSLCIDPAAGEVYVSDFGNADDAPAVKVYGLDDGRFRRRLEGAFSRPQGLALAAGKLLLVDSLRSQVLVLDPATGTEMGALGIAGTGADELFLPLDVSVDSVTADVFVTSNRTARVVVFRNGGGLL